MSVALHQHPYHGAPSRLHTTIAVVVVAHALALWGVHSELAELPGSDASGQVIMAEVFTDTPAALATPPSQPYTQPKPQRTPRNQSAKAEDLATTTPAEAASTSATSTRAPTSAAGNPKPGTPSLVEPSADADYLKNPPPVYPRASRRQGEQGTVVVRVFINTEGLPEKTEIRSTSGFPRLDQAAQEAVQRWRFVPGRRSGTPEAMWFNIPVRFILE